MCKGIRLPELGHGLLQYAIDEYIFFFHPAFHQISLNLLNDLPSDRES